MPEKQWVVRTRIEDTLFHAWMAGESVEKTADTIIRVVLSAFPASSAHYAILQ